MKEFTFDKRVNPRQIVMLLKGSDLAGKFDYLNTKDDQLTIFFNADLSSAEESLLSKAINELQDPEKELRPSLPEHVDNAAAIAMGLEIGKFYRTGDIVKVVHNGT